MTDATPNAQPPLLNEAVGLTHRPYQAEGIDFLWRRKRGMITDAPGLGKTPQGALASEPPALIVCPTYLTGQWCAWLQEHFPKRKAAVAKGNRFDREKVIADETLDFLIVNKEMLRTHIKPIKKVIKRYNTMIVDESHHLRNRQAEHSKGAVELAKKVERVYLLSATPIWKEVDDLYMQLQLLFPSVFTSYWDFVDKWCISDATRYGTKIVGMKKEMIAELEELLGVIRVGRTYEQAGRDLPPVIENIVKLDFSRDTRKVYDDAKNGYRLQIMNEPALMMTSAMQVMHTLRQITGFEKVDAIKETVEDTRPYHKDRYVIFTWYKDAAYNIAQALPGSLLVTGDYKPDERALRAKSGKPIVATISAMSEGVDLSHMRMVIFAEEHWPPGSAVQALARVRRERLVETNEEPILVYYMLVEKTIDTTIHEITRRRSATIKDVMKESLDLYL